MSGCAGARDRGEPSDAQVRISALVREIAAIRGELLHDEQNVIRRVQITMDLNIAIGRLLKVRAAIEPQQSNEKRRVS